MMLTFLKNLKSQNNQSKKKKRQKLLKMQLYFLMEGKTFSIPLKVEYFQKKKQGKGFTSILYCAASAGHK